MKIVSLFFLLASISFANDLLDLARKAKTDENWLDATKYYQEYLTEYPKHLDIRLELARVYAYSNDIQRAIKNCQIVLNDSQDYLDARIMLATYYWWSNKPHQAIKELGRIPSKQRNQPEVITLYNNIQQSLALKGSAQFKMVTETEDKYAVTQTVIPLQEYAVQKRLSDNLLLQSKFIYDKSEKRYVNDQAKVDLLLKESSFSNLLIQPSYLLESGRINSSIGYSFNKSTISNWNISWLKKFEFSQIFFSNTIGAGYELFYYWSDASRYILREIMDLKWNDLQFIANFSYAQTNKDSVFDFDPIVDTNWLNKENTHFGLSTKILYKLPWGQNIKLQTGLEYNDYQYHSLNFYTPHERNIYFVGILHHNKIYQWNYMADIKGGIDDAGVDYQGTPLADKSYFDIKLSAGYSFKYIDLSIGGGYFKNSNYKAVQYFTKINF